MPCKRHSNIPTTTHNTVAVAFALESTALDFFREVQLCFKHVGCDSDNRIQWSLVHIQAWSRLVCVPLLKALVSLYGNLPCLEYMPSGNDMEILSFNNHLLFMRRYFAVLRLLKKSPIESRSGLDALRLSLDACMYYLTTESNFKKLSINIIH